MLFPTDKIMKLQLETVHSQQVDKNVLVTCLIASVSVCVRRRRLICRHRRLCHCDDTHSVDFGFRTLVQQGLVVYAVSASLDTRSSVAEEIYRSFSRSSMMSHWVQHRLRRQKSRIGVAAIDKLQTCGCLIKPILEE